MHHFHFDLRWNCRPSYLCEVVIPKGHILLWNDPTANNGDFFCHVVPVVHRALTPLPEVLQFCVYIKEEVVNGVGFLLAKTNAEGPGTLVFSISEKRLLPLAPT
jgi:hypothetical protein